MRYTADKVNKRQEQAANSRENLLQAAKRLFSEHGYAATTVRSINREVGLTDGILYHYFPGGKAQIFSVLMLEGFDRLFAFLSEMSEGLEGLSIEESLSQFYASADRLLLEDPQLIRLALMESDNLTQLEKEKFSKGMRSRIEWLAEFLRQRHLAGEIKELDFLVAAQQFMSSNLNRLILKVLRIDLFSTEDIESDRKRTIQYIISQVKPALPSALQGTGTCI